MPGILMRITRSQSIYISVALIITFGMISAAAIYTSRPNKVSGPTLAQLQNILPEAKIAMDKFQRSEVKDGKKVWEIEAERGEFSPVSGDAALIKSQLKLYRPNNEVVTIISDRAILKLEGTKLKLANLQGNVQIVRNDTLRINTEEAVYDKDQGIVSGTKRVKILQGINDVSADTFRAKIDSSEVFLKGNVVSRVVFNEEKRASS